MKRPVWAEVISRNIIKVIFEEPVKLGESLDISLDINGEKWDFVAAMKDYMSTKVDLVLRKKLAEEDLSKDIFISFEGKSIRVYPTKVLDEFAVSDDVKLGSFIEDGKTFFRLWCPVAKSVNVLLYKDPNGDPVEKVPMKRKEKGLWEVVVDKYLGGWFYLYEIDRLGETVRVVDIYSVSTSLDGEKSAVVDLRRTNPEGWEKDNFLEIASPTDAVVYEIHIADITAFDENIPEKFRGKYLGLTCGGKDDDKETSIEHLKSLGITHVQIMPVMIFRSCKEDDDECYNWGYDPYLYMVPSGKYSTDPNDPYKRIRELKTLIKTLHDNGIGVILDVVFPHTYRTGKDSPFDATIPFYYYKIDDRGNYVDLTGCGNTTDSKKRMMKKLMMDTVRYWLEEFHVDGFRFDQMGVIDFHTMKELTELIKSINPYALVYGEPWGGGAEVEIPKGKQKGCGFGVFNDVIRDAIRGSVFEEEKRGFVMAGGGHEKELAISMVGSPIYLGGFAEFPAETINYAECHDNHTLYDKNKLASIHDKNREWTEDELKKAQKLAGALILTAIGIPFLHLGQDFCRTKNFNPNSYNASIEINGIDWKRKEDYLDVYKYYKGLIKLRKEHRAFRAADPVEIRFKTKILKASELFVVLYYGEHLNDDPWKHIFLLFNGSLEEKEYHLPPGIWNVVVNDEKAGVEVISRIERVIKVPPISACVLWG